MLEFAGFGTLEANGGIEGVALAQEHLPDLVLMDIRMPDLSGNDALKLLREDSRTAELPIVALTSSTMRGDEERFLTQGFDGYLPKPISVREFTHPRRSSSLCGSARGARRRACATARSSPSSGAAACGSARRGRSR